jgi:hypothetical protein
MGAEDHGISIGYFSELVDEYRATMPKALHHETIVHHLMTDVDRGAEEVECPLDDVDGAVDAGAEAVRVGE